MVFSFSYLAFRALVGALIRSRRSLGLKVWVPQTRSAFCEAVRGWWRGGSYRGCSSG
jgi:hypothetical protein